VCGSRAGQVARASDLEIRSGRGSRGDQRAALARAGANVLFALHHWPDADIGGP